MRPRLLDLFCGAGGASVGYHRAGFDVTGVDIAYHKDYPFPLLVEDAMQTLEDAALLDGFDVIHASPPCQGYTTMSNRYRGAGGKADSWLNLIPDVHRLLWAWGGTYVIENVPGARVDMRSPFVLHGGMFGLRVHRPRMFDCNAAVMIYNAPAPIDPLGVYGKTPDGRRLFTRTDGTSQRAATSLEEGRDAMGVDWMTDWDDVREAIPPSYSQFIGEQLLDQISRERVSA